MRVQMPTKNGQSKEDARLLPERFPELLRRGDPFA
jgi:hypothetical protein